VGAAAAPNPAPPPGGGKPETPPGAVATVLRRLRVAYQNLVNFPDAQIGWLPAGVRGGRKILAGWAPDLIFASAPPFTTLLIARALGRRGGIPLVVEYRDRFLEDPYWTPTGLRRRLIRTLEEWWMKQAKAIVTVSDPWAEDYRARFRLPVLTAYNGFDPDDFPADYPRADGTDPTTLRIVYTGILYPDRRDPSPLFEAIALMGEAGRKIVAEFYGPDLEMVTAMADRHGVRDRVRVSGSVPYKQSIDLQMNADVLLLLQWNDPRERGNVPGKLFEYIGARRPVLGLGTEDGVPARILRERGIGIVLNDPARIAGQLGAWLAEKRSNGCLPLLPPAARAGYSRPEQYAAVETFLRDVVDGRV
jgi:hypothetical protein